MGKKAFLAIVVASIALCCLAEDARGGLVEGKTWAFLAEAPEGWLWDSASLRPQGILGLFYKMGSRFSPSGLHMYIRPTDKRAGEPASLAEFMAADEAAFMGASPGGRVRGLASYTTAMDYVYEGAELDDEAGGYYQARAYYEGDDAYFIFVLSCRSPEERRGEQGAFHALLDSFTYIRKE